MATCHFVRRKEVLLLCEAGVGKSYIAQAVGHRACLADDSVLYTTANQLLTTLRAAYVPQRFLCPNLRDRARRWSPIVALEWSLPPGA